MKIYRRKISAPSLADLKKKQKKNKDEYSNTNHNSGYIEITSVITSNKNSCFWDNLDFFIYNNKKIIKKECEQELVHKNLYVKEIFKAIETLINAAILENMLTKINKND